MEFIDIVDKNGLPTGKITERKIAHTEGIRHRTAHIWIIREYRGRIQVLLQKRSVNKDSFPGKYDTSSAGHIQAGDEPQESALRELSEELEIFAAADELVYAGKFPILYKKEFYGKMFHDNEIAFVYIYTEPVNIKNLTLQKEEVEEVRWFDLEETYHACVQNDPAFCVPLGGFKLIAEYVNQNTEKNKIIL